MFIFESECEVSKIFVPQTENSNLDYIEDDNEGNIPLDDMDWVFKTPSVLDAVAVDSNWEAEDGDDEGEDVDAEG